MLVISVNSIKEQLSVSRSRLSEVISTDSLKGAVKDAINQKVTNYQIPLVDNYVNALDSIVSRYDGLVKLFQDTVSETDNSAIIKTEYLERIKQRMTDPYHNVAALAIFQDTKLRDQQIENSKALHEELIRYIRHYNPETAFDLSQMSEQELQTLGRTISLVSHGNGGRKPRELIDFLKGNEVTFEKEITGYDNGQHYFKSKIQITRHFKGESAITFNT